MMTKTRRLSACALLTGLIAAPWLGFAAQSGAQGAVDVQNVGPPVGARVPDFSLQDQHGKARTFQSLMGPKGAVLVFFRSADW